MIFPDLDLMDLEDIPPVRRYYDVPRVSVTETGLVSMNGAFRKLAGDQREFRAKISKDGRCLVLFPHMEPNICFSREGGYLTHREMSQVLEKKGRALPAVYDLIWDETADAWIGCCQELPEPPAVQARRRTSGKGSGGRTAA